MTLTRRQMMGFGGAIAAALVLPARKALAQDVVEIRMSGSGHGAHVWYDPIGIRIQPGQMVRWINQDEANSHSATAYHPANFDKPRRVPEKSESWDSGFLLPGDAFAVRLDQPGVYDYYCIPHEMAGMVGRIVVGEPQSGWSEQDEGLPEAAMRAFPPVDEIMANAVVRVDRHR